MSGRSRQKPAAQVRVDEASSVHAVSPASGQGHEAGRRDLLVALRRMSLPGGVPTTSSNLPRAQVIKEMHDIVNTWVPTHPNVQELVRCFFMTTDAGRSMVNVWDSGPQGARGLQELTGEQEPTVSNHLLMQQVAVLFDVSDKKGVDVGWDEVVLSRRSPPLVHRRQAHWLTGLEE
jgi:hypothetical protein